MVDKGLLKNYVYPVATLAGSIIGVGFLSLPYITSKVGMVTMLFYFVVLTSLVILIHLIFGQISLKTPDFKRWPGFVGFYLGSKAKSLILVSMILGTFGILLAYLLVGAQFLAAIFSPIFGGNLLSYVLLYFVVLSTVIYFKGKVISRFEFWAMCALVIALSLVAINGLPQMKMSNIWSPKFQGGLLDFFLPYGAILFSLWGTGLIPEIEEMLRGHKQLLKRILVIGTLIPAVVYLVFIFLVLGITGANTTESALIGLQQALGGPITVVALAIGVITTFTACIAQGLLLKKVFIYDVGIKEFTAWGLTCIVPLLLFLIGFNSFIPLISFIGGVFLGIDGILIMLIYKKIGGKLWVIYPLLGIFILGIVYEIVYYLPSL